MSCTICQHPKRQEIDRALAAGSATLAALSREYGLSTSALQRHKAHLQVKMKQARERVHNNLIQSCCFWLSQAIEMTMAAATAARAEGNYKLLLQAVSQGTRLINMMMKQEVPLEDRLVYAILTSPQWAAQPESFLPDDPTIMTACREALAGTLSTACPAEPPPSPAPAFPENPDHAALQKDVSISAPPKSIAENRKPKTENRLPKKWEKSGKSPGNDCYIIDKEEQYRLFELEKKISQLDLQALTRGLSKDRSSRQRESHLRGVVELYPHPER